MAQLPKSEAWGAPTYGFLFSMGICACITVLFPCGVHAEEDSLSGLRLVEQECPTDTRREAIAIDAALAITSDIGKVEARFIPGDWRYDVLIYGPGGQLLSTTTCCSLEGAKVTFSLLSDPKGETDLVVATSGIDPSNEEHFSIEVFQADSGRRIGEIWSVSPPVILEPGGERETVGMVFSKDIFGIGRPDAPAWPVVVNVRRGLVFVPLHDHLDVVRSSLEESRSALESWREFCRDMQPCPFNKAARRLEAQLSALESLVGASAATH